MMLNGKALNGVGDKFSGDGEALKMTRSFK